MKIKGKIIVVTGAANGIGQALAIRFSKEKAKKIVCVDIDESGVEKIAHKIKGNAIAADVSNAHSMKELIAKTEREIGPIDLFCSNAGVSIQGGVDIEDENWDKLWKTNVMSHVWAARNLIPLMVKRGGGYLLNTISAAGLLNQIGSAPYGVTKHAAVGLSEWIAITYGAKGIKVSILCPQAVKTRMLQGNEEGVASIDGILTADAVAKSCVKGIKDEIFLILPHREVAKYIKRKAKDYGKWIVNMQNLNSRFEKF